MELCEPVDHGRLAQVHSCARPEVASVPELRRRGAERGGRGGSTTDKGCARVNLVPVGSYCPRGRRFLPLSLLVVM